MSNFFIAGSLGCIISAVVFGLMFIIGFILLVRCFSMLRGLVYKHKAEPASLATGSQVRYTAQPSGTEVSPEVLAAITAAIAAVWQEDTGFVVRHVKRVNNAPAWNRAGRDDQTYSRV